MESKELQELIELISRSNFKTFELEREGLKLKMIKEDASAAPVVQAQLPTSLPTVLSDAAKMAPQAAGGAAKAASTDGLHEVHSPIVGTYYSAPSPGTANFVEVGARVTKGQVLCIVEAMKVMNEIESEINAEVVEILVANAQPVEYDEVMFRLRPLGP